MTEEERALLEEVNEKLDRLDATLDRQYKQNSEVSVRLKSLYNLFLKVLNKTNVLDPIDPNEI